MLFRKKRSRTSPPPAQASEAPPSAATLTLTVLNGAPEVDLARKLALEARTCVTCGYDITNPMSDRCPRCFSRVPLSEHTNCGECSHQGNCTYAGSQELRGS